MRNVVMGIAATMFVILLASFAPISWSGVPHKPTTLGSLSPTELTLAARPLQVGDQADAF